MADIADTTPESWEARCAEIRRASVTATLADQDATITELMAEVKRLTADNAELVKALTFTDRQLAIERQRAADCVGVAYEWQKRVQGLEEALEPLAKAVRPGVEPWLPDDFVLCMGHDMEYSNLTLGDVRRAQRVLGVGK